jgi:hypothetical protein
VSPGPFVKCVHQGAPDSFPSPRFAHTYLVEHDVHLRTVALPMHVRHQKTNGLSVRFGVPVPNVRVGQRGARCVQRKSGRWRLTREVRLVPRDEGPGGFISRAELSNSKHGAWTLAAIRGGAPGTLA